MLSAADILIVVEPMAPEYELFADRIRRDLRDLNYSTDPTTKPRYQATLKVSWTDADGWTLAYNNQAQTFILHTLKYLERTLYEDRILVNQKWMPPGRSRPFQEKN